MELHEALAQIDVIRRQVARSEKFRGYRALPVFCGGALALAAAAGQDWLVPDPVHNLAGYLTLWVAVAVAAGALSAGDVWRRHHRDASLRGAVTRLACEQFAPSVVAGGLVTWVIAGHAPEAAWMLPGLWAVLFGLGLFASWRLLPSAIFAVAAWYLVAGCICLAQGPQRAGLSAWTMGLVFGFGQLAAAAVLLRQDDDPAGCELSEQDEPAAEEVDDAP